MAGPASRLYGQNILNLIRLMTRNAAFDPTSTTRSSAAAASPTTAACCTSRPASFWKDRALTESIALLTIFVLAAFVGSR